ncbi:transposase [Streptomyces sp. NBC_01235]|uniref:transposase n=1 Tax=Streptomyces sp. NBC_01235 TaxID=2903788 RepID=UPI003FA39F03
MPPVVVADAGYGQNADFRHALAGREIPVRGRHPGRSDRAAARRGPRRPTLVRQRPPAGAGSTTGPGSRMPSVQQVARWEGSRGSMRSHSCGCGSGRPGCAPAACSGRRGG